MEQDNTELYIKPEEKVKLQILADKDNVLTSLEEYHKIKYQCGNAPDYLLKAKIRTLWMNILPMYKEKGTKYEEIKKLIFSENTVDIINGFLQINQWIYEIGISKIDSVKKRDGYR